MKQEIEIEYKNLLTEDEFKMLLVKLGFPEDGAVQENFYFETPDFHLKEQRAALRIREKNDKYVLTLKEPHPEGLLETHDLLTAREANAWLTGKPVAKEHTAKQLKRLQIVLEDLRLFGSLWTERREISYKNVLLVLDFSKYHGTFDYELELEAKSQAEGIAVFEALLNEYNIPRRKTPNKIERFFQSIK
ncbi:CYTH domain-containing protein [Ralstonia pickettii]|nr:CYTH domain-containing protein [Ralstonia pickettii]